jgi:citrate synthase
VARPTATRNQVSAQKRADRALDPHVAATLAGQPSSALPVDTLRTAVSLLAANDPAEHNITPAAIRAKAPRLFAVLLSIIAADRQHRHGSAQTRTSTAR